MFERLIELQKEEINIIRMKNADYSNDSDPFANFRMFGKIGFLVRMSDKLSRLKQIFESGETHVKDESIKDTLQDLSNYCNLLLCYLEDSKKLLF